MIVHANIGLLTAHKSSTDGSATTDSAMFLMRVVSLGKCPQSSFLVTDGSQIASMDLTAIKGRGAKASAIGYTRWSAWSTF